MRGYSAPFRKDRTSGKEKKWLLSCSYNSHGNNVCTHLQIIGKTLDKLSASYDNIIHLGDFNVEPEEAKMSEFLNMYSLKNLVSQKQRCQIFTNLHWQCWNNTIRNKNLSCCSIKNTKISGMINLEANLISYVITI